MSIFQSGTLCSSCQGIFSKTTSYDALLLEHGIQFLRKYNDTMASFQGGCFFCAELAHVMSHQHRMMKGKYRPHTAFTNEFLSTLPENCKFVVRLRKKTHDPDLAITQLELHVAFSELPNLFFPDMPSSAFTAVAIDSRLDNEIKSLSQTLTELWTIQQRDCSQCVPLLGN